MKNKHIYVIGAGVAGLTAASLLKKAGYQVTILEARTRIGGLIKVDYSLGVPFGCGAFFVHGINGNPVYELLQKYQPKLVYFDDLPKLIFDSNKQIIPMANLVNTHSLFQIILKEAKQLVASTQDIPLLTAIKQVLQNNNYPITPDELSWQLMYLGIYNGIEPQYLSTKYWDQGLEFSGGNYLLLSTYESLIKDFAEGQNILLNTIVQRINYGNTTVQIETNRGNFQADQVIVTVPLGVLQSNQLKFFPELPPIKKIALANLKMGFLNRIGLLFPQQFWPKDCVNISYVDRSNSNVSIFLNDAYFFNTPVLSAGVYGKKALELEQAGDQAAIENTMSSLKELFGSNIPDPIKTITTHWVTDPFSLGSYSCVPVGANGEDFDVLAEPLNNQVFFAGEATSRAYQSTVPGAYVSGIREATRILNLD